MSHVARTLDLLSDKQSYPSVGPPERRWGELLRETPALSSILQDGQSRGLLVPLRELGRIRSGVVTRANSYFIVRELPFDQIPKRFHVTRQDSRRVAVVMDGLDTPHKLEREFLHRIVKGPEELVTPTEVEESESRVFAVPESKEALRAMRAHGALEYLRRGETVPYNTSDDDLKGGIPAKRSQVKGRKPFWYSLTIPDHKGPRLLVPEHVDKRYIATLLPPNHRSVIIDTLYTIEMDDPAIAAVVVAGLMASLSWYQIELRGRTQHGEGVLKVKIPDWGGVLVANPGRLAKEATRDILHSFEPLSTAIVPDSLATLGDASRVDFDVAYLRAVGQTQPEEVRLLVEREIRALVSERRERKASVADAKADRRRAVGVGASVDSYAARLAANLPPYPNPEAFVTEATELSTVPLLGPPVGKLTIGTELFNQGEVYAGDICIARAPDVASAQFVRAAVLHDPARTHVQVPVESSIGEVMTQWRAATVSWERLFADAQVVLRTIGDDRLRNSILARARELLHAE